jgi:hypothetical protein
MRYLLISILMTVCLTGIAIAQVEIDTVGTCGYPWQTLGPSGTRILIDTPGAVHVAWMAEMSTIAHRGIFYNCKTNGQWVYPYSGQRIDYRDGAGFDQLGALDDNRAVIAYHSAATNAETIFVAIDIYRYLGLFDYFRPLNHLNGDTTIFPYLTVDRNNRIQMVSSTFDISGGIYRTLIYSRSNNSGISWSDPQPIGNSAVGAILTASRVSDKVAILHSLPLADNIYALDISMIESQDGLIWDFANNQVNITNYPGENLLYAVNDYDAVYDINDNLHVVWVAQRRVSEAPEGPTYIFHYDRNTGTISQIAEYFMIPDSTCQTRYGHLALDMVSIGSSQDGKLFVSYTRFSRDDCSADNIANGEIYAQYSEDSGLSWSNPVNITNTPSPNCTDALCQSEIYPSMAETVDDYLHMICLRYNGVYDLVYYENPMIYIKYPIAELGISESDVRLPNSTSLSVYPDPFNAQTTISFILDHSGPVILEVYDLLGRRVATLVDAQMLAGEHQVVWDARNRASGVYYLSLRAGSQSATLRMTLLK